MTTPELAPPLLTTTPHQREDISALDRFSVHRCPTRPNDTTRQEHYNCQKRGSPYREMPPYHVLNRAS
ncbi:hypothetical protein TNCV_3784611 [Trichonephila clavipes]|nr:hypothetical protein TNCV_3784611 [Trichonephila clavipes]